MAEPKNNTSGHTDEYFRLSIPVPEHYNFGYDVIDEWAKKDRNKLAMIWVSQKGGREETHVSGSEEPLEPGCKYPPQIRD